jgi:Glycosyl transferases group 1
MSLTLGYRWFEAALGYHMERALTAAGCPVTFAGIGASGHPGIDSETPITALPHSDAYLWIDPAGRYFPPGIEDADTLTAGYIVDAHLGHWRESAARFFDVVFLAQKRYVEPYKRLLGHEQVYWLPLAAAGDVHIDHQLPRIYDVAFVGNSDRAHANTPRVRRLDLLAKRYRTNPFGTPCTPAEVGLVYSQAKIVFNTSIAGDATMRLFEGAASGALVLTDAIAPDNGGDLLFRIGDEIAQYTDDADLITKLNYFLAHDAERERIARAGQARVRKEHTYAHRARFMRDVLSDAPVQRVSPMRTAPAGVRRRERLRVYTHLHMLDAVFDVTRGLHPLRRVWSALPCLARRVLR